MCDRVGVGDFWGFGGWNLYFLTRINSLSHTDIKLTRYYHGWSQLMFWCRNWGLRWVGTLFLGCFSGINCVICKYAPICCVGTCLYMHLTSFKCTGDYTYVAIVSPITCCKTCCACTYLIHPIHDERHSCTWHKCISKYLVLNKAMGGNNISIISNNEKLLGKKESVFPSLDGFRG